MKKIDNNVKLFNLPFFGSSELRLLEILENQLKTPNGLFVIFTPNPEQIMLAKRDKEFASYLGLADILVPDGVGVVFASRILSLFSHHKPLRERITGIDLAQSITELATQHNQPILLLGGQGYSSKPHPVISELQLINYQDKTLAWMPGYENVSKPQAEEQRAVEKAIRQLKPAVVFVAYGAPNQEKWLIDHRDLLEKNGVLVAMVVGGAFDMLLGKVKRAPKAIRSMGMEWLYRLVRQPWRVRRQLQLISFAGLTLQTVFAVLFTRHRE